MELNTRGLVGKNKEERRLFRLNSMFIFILGD